MIDQELADKVVALGVGRKTALPGWFGIDPMGSGVRAKYFVRDWRIAGALMEKFDWGGLRDTLFGDEMWDESHADPRTIIEKCVEALTNE